MISLSLLPLTGMSLWSYLAGRKQIQDSIRLSLRKMAQDTADKIDLVLRGKKEEIHSLADMYPLFSRELRSGEQSAFSVWLNRHCFNHEGCDILLVVDAAGKIVGMNTTDRDMTAFPENKIAEIYGADIAAWPEEREMFLASIRGHASHHNWYSSDLARKLYGYSEDDARRNIALSEPIRDPSTHEVIGVWISILNWSYLQNILDKVASDMSDMDLRTGYGFMASGDASVIIGIKAPSSGEFIADSRLASLRRAILRQKENCDYTLPDGGVKIAGLAPISDTSFGWVVGVEIDEEDVLRPVKMLIYWLAGGTVLMAALIVIFTWMIAGRISEPLKTMTNSALMIAQGKFRQRVPIRSSDELGILASTFNEMARALSTRDTQLQELTRNLETKVKDRTLELENSHEALKQAYLDLQNTQEQLVHTEKMASLGQLVSGIAHEIRNPLNFIYGNTGFLSDYTQKLQSLVENLDELPGMTDEARREITRRKESIHYAFIRDDLKILIDNFTEGARRINAIVADLRTFSRMDTEATSDIDVRDLIEMSLNLLSNQYKNRIEIHREYGDIPKIQGYAGKLNQVLMNLLSNAFQAIPDKGNVRIRTRAADDDVEIVIEDDGTGIPRENLKRIFEPFFTTKPVGQGTGLGLSISYGIIEQHHGKIHVMSVPGKGTMFSVRLPIVQEKA